MLRTTLEFAMEKGFQARTIPERKASRRLPEMAAPSDPCRPAGRYLDLTKRTSRRNPKGKATTIWTWVWCVWY